MIHSTINEFESIVIEDIQGRIVMKMEDNNSKEIDISNLKSGMYFVIIFALNSKSQRV